MDEPANFLGSTLPRLRDADSALHNGDPGPRKAVWSHNDPVTLFGAAQSAAGWDEIQQVFEGLAARFSQCASWECDIIAAEVSGDLAYIVGFEHINGSIANAPAASFSLRVTTVLRREGGEWKVVHRHGDALPESDTALAGVQRMRGSLAADDDPNT